ncbi:MAG: ribonuclease H family protein [Saprospiraceae bacterium]|nr:ribonuclease H family protein [Saprospiraceae bacterium]MCB0675804.1 ribonuclease H family protein [Saprospiraceae bacterium]
MAKSKKFYVVWKGHEPGIYTSWDKCLQQVKNFPDAQYKSFKTREEAEEAFLGNYSPSKSPKQPKARLQDLPENVRRQIVWDSIAVDAACSGNPGHMEYQGVDTRTGVRLFHQAFPLGTNNIGEFLAIVHALAWFHQQQKDTPIYTDSRNALLWVKAGKCRTKLVRNAKTAGLYEVIARAEKWLASHSYRNPLLKWDTENWGEIPADFGRK